MRINYISKTVALPSFLVIIGCIYMNLINFAKSDNTVNNNGVPVSKDSSDDDVTASFYNMKTTKPHILYVTTFDGSFTALNYYTGEELWTLEDKFGMYTQSQYFGKKNMKKDSFRRAYDTQYLIPSLDGTMYYFKGNHYKVLKNEKSEFFQNENSGVNYIRLKNSIKIVGVDPSTGIVYYSCDGNHCNYSSHMHHSHLSHHNFSGENDIHCNREILVIESDLKNRFSSNFYSGRLNWNISHSAYNVSYFPRIKCEENMHYKDSCGHSFESSDNSNKASSKFMEKSKSNKYGGSGSSSCSLREFIKKTLKVENNIRYYASEDVMENVEFNWTYSFDSPVVGLWLLLDEKLHRIDLKKIIFYKQYKQLLERLMDDNHDCDNNFLILNFYHNQPYFIPVYNNNARRSVGDNRCLIIYTLTETLRREPEPEKQPEEVVDLVNLFHHNHIHSRPKEQKTPINQASIAESGFVVTKFLYYNNKSSKSLTSKESEYLTLEELNEFENIKTIFGYISYWTSRVLRTLSFVIPVLASAFNGCYFIVHSLFFYFKKSPETSPLTVRNNKSFFSDEQRQSEELTIKNELEAKSFSDAKEMLPSVLNDEIEQSPGKVRLDDGVYTSRMMMDFNFVSTIAKGGFGQVYEVRHKLDGSLYAVKRVRISDCQLARQKCTKEATALTKMFHQNILRFYNAWFEPTVLKVVNNKDEALPLCPYLQGDNFDSVNYTPTTSEIDYTNSINSNPFAVPKDYDPASAYYEKTTKEGIDSKNCSHEECDHRLMCDVYFQTELCKKETLDTWLANNKDRDYTLCINYFKQILSAVCYIHSKGFIHRDIKPSNIFFSRTEKDLIKIGDFGLVTDIKLAQKINSQNSLDIKFTQQQQHTGDTLNLHYYTKHVGTQLYMAPELKNLKKYDDTVDTYSLGIVLIELMTYFGTGFERVDVICKAKKHELPCHLLEEHNIVGQMVDWMLADDVLNRPTCKNIYDSDILTSILKKYNVK